MLSFYFFFFLTFIFSFNECFWVKKHAAGHLFIKTLKFSKFIADISIARETRNFNNFTPVLNPEFDSLMTQLAIF